MPVLTKRDSLHHVSKGVLHRAETENAAVAKPPGRGHRCHIVRGIVRIGGSKEECRCAKVKYSWGDRAVSHFINCDDSKTKVDIYA